MRSLDGFVADIVAHPEGFGGLFARMGYLPLLPLLELPYPEVRDRLAVALTAAGVPDEQTARVSLRELVGFAVGCWSAYWVGRAVEWLGAGFPLDAELAGVLDRRIPEHPEWPQSLRHQAFGLVRRWQRTQ